MVLHHKILNERDVSRRIVLYNVSQEGPQGYWNGKYVQYSLRADTEMERRFLAGVLVERYGAEEAVVVLNEAMRKNPSAEALRNADAMVELVQREKPKERVPETGTDAGER